MASENTDFYKIILQNPPVKHKLTPMNMIPY